MFHTTRIRARYEESDQMGFIHHSNHIVWIEQARMDLFRECGINYKELEANGFLLPVIKAVLKYVSPAYFDDEILVQAAFTKVSHAKIKIEYQMFRNSRELLCYGYTEHCFLTKEAKKPIPIPEDVKRKLKLSRSAMEWKTAGML